MPYYNRKSGGGILDTTHLYMTLSVANHYSGTGVDSSGNLVQNATADKEVAINFDQSRGQAYLETPDESFLSVQRFTIYSPNLPVFIAQPIVGSNSINETIYTISVDISGTGSYQFPVIWQPQNLNVSAPSSPVTQNDIFNPYYYCYSYEWFIKCINDSITANLPGFVSNYNNPFMVYDTLTNLFSVVGSVKNYRTTNLGASLATNHPSKFFMNNSLYNLFASIPAIFVANTVGVLKDYQIIFSTGTNQATSSGQSFIINTKTIGTGNTAYNAIYSSQEYGSLALWTPIKSIVFRVSKLTVVNENIATPVIYQNGNNNINAGKQNTDILPTMIEYSVPLETGTEYKPYIFFEPRGEFRLTDLNNNCQVQALQFNVFWKDTFGNLIPFYLSIGSCLTLKLLFRKKSFNSDQL